MKQLEQLKARLAKLLSEQQFAALATHQGDQLHNSLVCFAASDDLRSLYLCTPKATRKYQNLIKAPEVSLLIHNSANRSTDINDAMAVTVSGIAVEASATQQEAFTAIYLAKHPHLKHFVQPPSTAIIEVQVQQYDLVTHFQDVTTLTLKQP